jgi:hypothetical protein
MYAATLRLINPTTGGAEADALLIEREFIQKSKLTDDGTVQLTVEDLELPRIQVTADQMKKLLDYDSMGDLMYYADSVTASINEMLDIAFRQGRLSAVKDKVTFKFGE